MCISDPIADMFCIIKNAWLIKKTTVNIQYSKIKHQIINLLLKEGFINKFEISKIENKNIIKVTLKYNDNGKSVINNIIRRSTPGKREYIPKKEIVKVKNGYGITILSTNKGILTGKDARQNNVGGEVLCYIW